MFQDTIAAIATADAMGAISVIRISGSDAIQIVTDLTGKDLSDAKGYTIHYATIKEGNESVDEVLVSLFRAPKSYTGEDVVEISCHGGVYITRKVLSLILGAGARLRPILMTSLAMVIGLLPMMFAMGVGKNGNQTLGAAAVGGMLIGTFCQLFVVPVLFVIFQALQEKIKPLKFDDEENLEAAAELRQYARKRLPEQVEA